MIHAPPHCLHMFPHEGAACVYLLAQCLVVQPGLAPFQKLQPEFSGDPGPLLEELAVGKLRTQARAAQGEQLAALTRHLKGRAAAAHQSETSPGLQLKLLSVLYSHLSGEGRWQGRKALDG